VLVYKYVYLCMSVCLCVCVSEGTTEIIVRNFLAGNRRKSGRQSDATSSPVSGILPTHFYA
jgi:hypothetical protein